ncbi:MAG: nucleotidyltransferase domain-containing protein [Thermodesulfovibrionales bacterium]|jgi:predicted nucleotidyltransferase
MKTPHRAKVKDCPLQRGGVITASLFGSPVSGQAIPESDVDLAVLPDGAVQSANHGFRRLKIPTRLIELLSFEGVDGFLGNTALPQLSQKGVKRSRVLFSEGERKRRNWIAKATCVALLAVISEAVQYRVLRCKIRGGDGDYCKGSLHPRGKRLEEAL